MYDYVTTDLTSRGVPARLRIFTTTWTPLRSSNTRRAGMESTKIHNKVSRMMEASGTSEDLDSAGAGNAPALGDVGVLVADVEGLR